jgi:hypothetical protein
MLQRRHRVIGLEVVIATYRDEPEKVVGEVVAVRDTAADPVTHKQERQEAITRSRYLVTVKIVKGPPELEGKYRSYYHRFARMGRKRRRHAAGQ